MLKKISLLFLLTSFRLLCQENTVYENNFSRDIGDWSNSKWDDNTYYRQIKDGKFWFEHREAKHVYTTYKNLYIDKEKDFTFEYDITMTEGEPFTGVSIQLYGQNGYYYFFEIKPAGGGIWVGTYTKEGKWESFNKYESNDYLTKSKAVKGLNQNNHCKIQFGKDRVKYSVNNEVLFNEPTSVFKDFYSFSNFAIRSGGVCKFSIDNIIFKQDQQAIKLLQDSVANYKKIRLSDKINTSGADRTPVISADGKTLYFIRMWYDGNTGDRNFDDIYYSKTLSDTSWEKATNIGKPLNNSGHNSIIACTSDNNFLYLLNTYNADGSLKGGGFSISQRTGDGWSVPVDVKIDDYYNTGGSVEACLSTDRNVFIYAIKRKETYGLNDLYISFKKNDGSYTAPKNMGEKINSWGWETCPFLAPDNKTLYFSTDGRPGFGAGDIFVTKRLDDTWLNWSEPLNLGKGINSPGAEGFFTIPASGNNAYVASTEAGTYDIYRLEIPKKAKPEPVVIFSGRVLNGKTKEYISSNIEINDLIDNKQLALAVSSPQDGSYSVLLTMGKKYSFAASKDGFYPVSENIDLSTIKEYKEYKKDLYLFPIEKGQTVKLNNIFFDFNKAELKEESFHELNKLKDLLTKNQRMKIEIGGHTDNVGDDDYNTKLSLSRVASVKEYLVKNNIAKERISINGYGENKPTDTNDTEEGRAKNRRVEFKILEL
jgi:outer membrane protein OmpA-like peptidoglycan-associated protein